MVVISPRRQRGNLAMCARAGHQLQPERPRTSHSRRADNVAPLDTVHELFKSVIEYAKKDLASEGTDELTADAKKELEDLDNERKAIQSEYVKMEQIYQSAEASSGGSSRFASTPRDGATCWRKHASCSKTPRIWKTN